MGPKKDKTKDLLLEAGRRHVINSGLSEGLDDVKLTNVLKEVDLSTGAAYNIWENQDEYRRELSLYIAENFEWADTSTVLAAIASLPEHSTMDDWVQAVADTYFPLFVANMDFFIVLRFWGVREPTPELTEAVRAGYELTHLGFCQLYTQAFEHYGLQVVAPHTADDITAMVTASLEGFALRHRFQPERVTDENGRLLFTQVLRTIVDNHLETAGS